MWVFPDLWCRDNKCPYFTGVLWGKIMTIFTINSRAFLTVVTYNYCFCYCCNLSNLCPLANQHDKINEIRRTAPNSMIIFPIVWTFSNHWWSPCHKVTTVWGTEDQKLFTGFHDLYLIGKICPAKEIKSSRGSCRVVLADFALCGSIWRWELLSNFTPVGGLKGFSQWLWTWWNTLE